MKVIFLDVDGVLNSMQTPAWMGDDWDLPLAKHICHLHRVVAETGAVIVVSSSWREYPYAMRKLELALKVFELPIYDVTPVIDLDRPAEIRAWLQAHPQVDRYVILDDETFSFQEEELENFVFVPAYTGLTSKEADQAIAILNLA